MLHSRSGLRLVGLVPRVARRRATLAHDVAVRRLGAPGREFDERLGRRGERRGRVAAEAGDGRGGRDGGGVRGGGGGQRGRRCARRGVDAAGAGGGGARSGERGRRDDKRRREGHGRAVRDARTAARAQHVRVDPDIDLVSLAVLRRHLGLVRAGPDPGSAGGHRRVVPLLHLCAAEADAREAGLVGAEELWVRRLRERAIPRAERERGGRGARQARLLATDEGAVRRGERANVVGVVVEGRVGLGRLALGHRLASLSRGARTGVSSCEPVSGKEENVLHAPGSPSGMPSCPPLPTSRLHRPPCLRSLRSRRRQLPRRGHSRQRRG